MKYLEELTSFYTMANFIVGVKTYKKIVKNIEFRYLKNFKKSDFSQTFANQALKNYLKTVVLNSARKSLKKNFCTVLFDDQVFTITSAQFIILKKAFTKIQ